MMRDSLIARFFRWTGTDRSVVFSLISRGISVVGTPVTAYCVMAYLTPGEQGFFYTFQSVLALAGFLSLGLPSVLLVFASHERAALQWNVDGTVGGDDRAKQRLASLFRFGWRWFSLAAIVIAVGLYPLGRALFAREADMGVLWQAPWLFLVFVTAMTVVLSPINALIEGCGRVADVRFLGMVTPLICLPLRWTTLAVGGGLLAAPIFLGGGLLMNIGWLITGYRRFVRDLWKTKIHQNSVKWRELWPLQWRTGLKWMSGYLSVQLFSPLLFAFHGPEIAGRMGMSLSLIRAITGVSLIWVGNKLPLMGRQWASKQYSELDRTFLRSLMTCVAVMVAGSVMFIGAVAILRVVSPTYGDRLLPLLPSGLLLGGEALNAVSVSLNLYLCANKREPFVWLALTHGVLVLALNCVLGIPYGVVGMATGYLGASALIFSVAIYIFLLSRRRWQKEQGLVV